MTLGQKIKQARLELGVTQKELVGDHITRNMLSKIENDSATPSVKTLEFLASRLGLTTSYLMSDLTFSDGSSPDGLDEMRNAYKEGRYEDCINLLQNSQTAGTTDEGYLLRSLADLAAAREYLAALDFEKAKYFADSADYYNKQGLYYSAEIDAEMSLILAECANVLAPEEFEENAKEYKRSVESISFSARFEIAKAENLCLTGKTAEAMAVITAVNGDLTAELSAKKEYVIGLIFKTDKNYADACPHLLKAEELGLKTAALFTALELCFKELEDYKSAYHYATMQK
ncbi:MAG: helix-turn-helix transcriptional regulator [Oscillospiraceae bacterium]|nr:helix-turn-helix transcriptional regulator [Oscillospiraceae bacterium]